MTILREANHVTALARREIHQRWAVLGVAAALGLVPVVAGGFWPSVRADARTLSVVEFFVAQAIASFIGLGLVGDDLASGRMGWYFSRPLSGFAIWGGKIGGAGALAVAATLLMGLPTLFLVQSLAPREGLFAGTTLGAVGFVVFPLLFVGAGAVGGIVARAHTRWLLLDLACVTALPVLILPTSERIHALMKGARHDLHVLDTAMLLAFPAAFLVASAAGVMIGRVDARRAHAAASVTLWGILIPAQAALFGYVHWFVS